MANVDLLVCRCNSNYMCDNLMWFTDFSNGRFYNEDCFDAMKEIPDSVIDLIVTDPTYRTISGGTSSKEAQGWNTSVLSKNDGKIFTHNDVKIVDYMKEFYRVLKDETHCYVMTNNLNLQELLNMAEQVGFFFHNMLIWRKNNCTANRWYMKEMELTCFFYKKPAKKINNASSKQIFEFDNIRNKIHPTQKPVELMQHYIENSSKENDCILDPFSGYGSTAIAAINTNRKWVCIEKDKSYYDAAISRIQTHLDSRVIEPVMQVI